MAMVYSTNFGQMIRLPLRGPQDQKDVSRDTARDLSGLVGELAALKGDAIHWLTDPEYAALQPRLEAAHAATEAALMEAQGKAEREARRVNAPSRQSVRCFILLFLGGGKSSGVTAGVP